MLSNFEISALIISGSCVFLFKSKESILVFISLAVFACVFLSKLMPENQDYYAIKALIEGVFIALGISLRVKPSITIIFLIAFVYNVLSLIEFHTEETFFYGGYSAVMQALIVCLLLLNIISGLINGIANHFNISITNSDSGYSRFFRWTAL